MADLSPEGLMGSAQNIQEQRTITSPKESGEMSDQPDIVKTPHNTPSQAELRQYEDAMRTIRGEQNELSSNIPNINETHANFTPGSTPAQNPDNSNIIQKVTTLVGNTVRSASDILLFPFRAIRGAAKGVLNKVLSMFKVTQTGPGTA